MKLFGDCTYILCFFLFFSFFFFALHWSICKGQYFLYSFNNGYGTSNISPSVRCSLFSGGIRQKPIHLHFNWQLLIFCFHVWIRFQSNGFCKYGLKIVCFAYICFFDRRFLEQFIALFSFSTYITLFSWTHMQSCLLYLFALFLAMFSATLVEMTEIIWNCPNCLVKRHFLPLISSWCHCNL